MNDPDELTAFEKRRLNRLLHLTGTSISRAANEQVKAIAEVLSEKRVAVLSAAVTLFGKLPPGEQLELITAEKLARADAAQVAANLRAEVKAEAKAERKK
jgi:hypothetical protein